MDSYNHNNANKKRKFSTSKEREEDLKRQNKKSIGCFGRCCTRRKHDITAKENILKTSVGKIPLENDNINQESVSNVPMTRLTRSPLYNQSRFCQNALQAYYDPCIECVVQDGPDIWENIPKNFQNPSKQLYDNNKVKLGMYRDQGNRGTLGRDSLVLGLLDFGFFDFSHMLLFCRISLVDRYLMLTTLSFFNFL
jgi:hypothetical protein